MIITLGNKKRVQLTANNETVLQFPDYIRSVQFACTLTSSNRLYLSILDTAGDNEYSNYITSSDRSITLNSDAYFKSVSVVATENLDLQIVNPVFYREA